VKHQISVSLGLLLAVIGIALFATPALADNLELTMQSVECQKLPDCELTDYWGTQETFKSQFGPTDSLVAPAFKQDCFNLNPAMSHSEVHPELGANVGFDFPMRHCPCEN
jgi:hypothetical protein